MNLNLANRSLPSWVIQAITNLMQTAEQVFSLPKSGSAKKAWVKQSTLDLLEKVNVPGIPDTIEQPIKEALIDVAIEVIWALLFTEVTENVFPVGLRHHTFAQLGRL